MSNLYVPRSTFGSTLSDPIFGNVNSLFGYADLGVFYNAGNLLVREALAITIKDDPMRTPSEVYWGTSVGEFGKNIVITIVDTNNTPVDISSYTTRQVIVRSQDDIKTVTKTATFVLSGSDGRLQFSFATGEIDRPGEWNAQVVLSKTGATFKSQVFILGVDTTLA
jgi:hypothetical protein